MRNDFEVILRKHDVYGQDVENILVAVSDKLFLVAKETKKNEPYAINTIESLEKVAYERTGNGARSVPLRICADI